MNYGVTSEITKRLINPLSIFRRRNSPEKIQASNNWNNRIPRSPTTTGSWTTNNKNIDLPPAWTGFKKAERFMTPGILYSTIPERTFASVRIIEEISNGVYKCLYNKRSLILKYFNLNNPHQRSAFSNELRIGELRGIEKIGSKTLAYGTFYNDRNMIIACILKNDVTDVSLGLVSISLVEYMRRLKACPSENSLFYKKLFETLRQFYTKTGGYHGKLIGENIYVVYKKTNIDDIVNIKIINYGTHVTFKSNIKECTSIKDIFRRINNEFSQNTELTSHGLDNKFVVPKYKISRNIFKFGGDELPTTRANTIKSNRKIRGVFPTSTSSINPKVVNNYQMMYKSNRKPYTSNYETLKRALYPGTKHNFQRESKIKKVLV